MFATYKVRRPRLYSFKDQQTMKQRSRKQSTKLVGLSPAMGAYIDANLDPTEKKPFCKLLPEFIAKFPQYTVELTTHDTPPEFLRTKYRHYLKKKKNAQKEQDSNQASAQATTPAIAAPASTPAIAAPAPARTTDPLCE